MCCAPPQNRNQPSLISSSSIYWMQRLWRSKIATGWLPNLMHTLCEFYPPGVLIMNTVTPVWRSLFVSLFFPLGKPLPVSQSGCRRAPWKKKKRVTYGSFIVIHRNYVRASRGKYVLCHHFMKHTVEYSSPLWFLRTSLECKLNHYLQSER